MGLNSLSKPKMAPLPNLSLNKEKEKEDVTDTKNMLNKTLIQYLTEEHYEYVPNPNDLTLQKKTNYEKDLTLKVAGDLLHGSSVRTGISLASRDRERLINDCYILAEEFVKTGIQRGVIDIENISEGEKYKYGK